MQLKLFRARIVIALTFFFSLPGFAQLYPFRIYTEENGLPQTTVDVIFQDSKGYLWIGTRGGACRFDGTAFRDFTTKEGLLNNLVFDIKEDHRGNIWFATNSGISIYNGAGFTELTDINGLPSKHVFCLLRVKSGLLIGTSGGACRVSSNDLPALSDSARIPVEPFLSELSGRQIKKIFEDSKGRLWIGTDSGLVFQNNTELTCLTTAQGLPHNNIFSIAEDTDGNIWCGNHAGYSRIILDDNGDIISIESKKIIIGGKENPVRTIYCDKDGKIYMGVPYLTVLQKSDTSNTGYAESEAFLRYNGINANSIYSIFKDREGNFWYGGADHGISMFQGKIFQCYNMDFGASGEAVRGITRDRDGNIWLANNAYVSKFSEPGKQLQLTDEEKYFIEKIDNKKGISTRSVWSILTDHSGNVWFGGVGGLYKYDGKRYERFSDRKGFIGDVVMRIYEDKKNILWFLSFAGVNCYDPAKDSLYQPFGPASPFHNKRIKSVYHHSNGDYWFGSMDGLTCLSGGKYTHYTTGEGLPDNYIAVIIPDKKENLWLATGKGISKFNPLQVAGAGKKFQNITAKDGLNTDTPYLLIFDDEQNLWVGTNKGLDKITFKENGDVASIKFYGKDEGFMGIETNSNAAYKDEKGDLWFGTMKGAIRYQKKYERVNRIEPATNIEKLKVDYSDHPMSENMHISYDKNHLSFYYKAICLTNPKKVKYKFRLVNFDAGWSPETNETYTTYSNLPPGDYTFEVVACNNDGVWNKKPVSFHFIIEPPFWRTYWFYFLCLATLGLSIYLYVKWKTFQLEGAKKVLEKKVDERTHELSVQYKKLELANEEIRKNKDELENKNKDITDSINYAKRIQETLLPDIGNTGSFLNDFFICYRPKDIVSGDFYWHHENENDLYLAVVDCTGHGVPGAFMSLLGITFLNEIIAQGVSPSPAEILNQLRSKIIKELSQYGRDGETKDGMDISLVHWNKKKNTLQWAGANNPLWIIKEGKTLEEISPDKQPVGYYIMMKPFTNHVLDIKNGDAFYIFSDGFPDQFGGPKGKKFKYARLKELLLSVSHHTMHEQKKIILQAFDHWKGGLEQVDDVCIIGVRIGLI